MKTLFLLSSLIFSTYAYSNIEDAESVVNIDINDDKAVDFHTYYFRNVVVNQRALTTFKVTNNGNSRLDYQWSKISGDASYSASTNCARTLFPGQRCQFTIEFRPLLEGTSSGMFEMKFLQDYGVRVYVHGKAVR